MISPYVFPLWAEFIWVGCCRHRTRGGNNSKFRYRGYDTVFDFFVLARPWLEICRNCLPNLAGSFLSFLRFIDAFLFYNRRNLITFCDASFGLRSISGESLESSLRPQNPI